jgi:hypothetical protein
MPYAAPASDRPTGLNVGSMVLNLRTITTVELVFSVTVGSMETIAIQ